MLLSSFDPDEQFDSVTEELRGYILARDEGLCLICGKIGNGGLHHVIYRSKCGGHYANNLATLCLNCHYKIHNKEDKYKELLHQRIKENETRLRNRLV